MVLSAGKTKTGQPHLLRTTHYFSCDGKAEETGSRALMIMNAFLYEN